MCGLAGMLLPAPAREQAALEEQARRMGDALVHRGPDDSGVWADASAGIALALRTLGTHDYLGQADYDGAMLRFGRAMALLEEVNDPRGRGDVLNGIGNVHWRRGDAELNYRRFFTVTTLAGVRVEDADVLDASHVEVARWFDEGLVDGLRVDHPDGLRDPGDYLDDLARLTGGSYVLVEKILEGGEQLPTSWATAGTTGYDVLALLDQAPAPA